MSAVTGVTGAECGSPLEAAGAEPDALLDLCYSGDAVARVDHHGRSLALPVERWRAEATAVDDVVLGHCHGTTLDLGCGPGRMTGRLQERGHQALGVDRVPAAIRSTRRRGVAAVLRDAFDPMPGEGQWDTVLLADDNLGIGGDPERLLRRSAALLRHGGAVVAEVARPGVGVRSLSLRLSVGGVLSAPFPWAVVGAEAVAALALGAGLTCEGVHRHGSRFAAVLRKP